MITCDLCQKTCNEYYVHELAPDIMLCPVCRRMSAAEVVRHYLSASWSKCPKTGLACRTGTCETCNDIEVSQEK